MAFGPSFLSFGRYGKGAPMPPPTSKIAIIGGHSAVAQQLRAGARR
jgi:hypothetical protein